MIIKKYNYSYYTGPGTQIEYEKLMLLLEIHDNDFYIILHWSNFI